MKKLDYQYALKSDCEFELAIKNIESNIVEINTNNIRLDIDYSDYTWLLEFDYQSTHKNKSGELHLVTIDKKTHNSNHSQYFEKNQKGIRYLNLTGYSLDNNLRFICKYCSVGNNVKLLGFKKPALSDGNILIIAPHADDAELAAYGLYQDFSKNIWITTINAGQNVQKLSQQYVRNLDNNILDATKRKAKIRAWNSMTTPLLAGVEFEKLSYLGYFGITKESLYDTKNKPEVDTVVKDFSPMDYREMNSISLPNDSLHRNTGSALINDLVSLIEQVKPTTILVTDPEVDPHDEHVVAAHALSFAIKQANHKPERILLYVNHLRENKKFPYGPEHARTALPPWHTSKSVFSSYSCYSHSLSMETQKNKVVALDSMHDLRSKERFEKKLKQWWSKAVCKSGYKYYSNHIYFQTHIKSDETFIVVDINDYMKIMN